jgi:hypothetical protein
VNPSTQYERLTLLRRNQSFDAEVSRKTLALHFETEPLISIQTKGKRTFFLRRHWSEDDEPQVVYRVFADEGSAATGDNEVAYCRLRKPEHGIVIIAVAEVKEPFRKKGIATAVYECITRDLERAGALLWPDTPEKMTDSEFKMWWRCAPALVFYYPHRERLGFEPRREFEELLSGDGGADEVAVRLGPSLQPASGFLKKLVNARRWLFRIGG